MLRTIRGLIDGWKIFIPHAVWLIVSSMVFWLLPFNLEMKIICWGLMSIVLGILVGAFPERYWRPFRNNIGLWDKDKGLMPDVVLVLGFGYTRLNTHDAPGAANEFLVKWLNENGLDRRCIVQEGIWLAGSTEQQRHWKRMHEHNERTYVNTRSALRLAFLLEWVQEAKQILVVAHDLQLPRAAWVAQTCLEAIGRSDIRLWIPSLPKVPMVDRPVRNQWHTRFRLFFNCVERWWARPRDFLGR